MAGTGLGFAFSIDFWPLLVIAILGTLNPSSGDASVFLPLEHAALSHVAGDKDRTRIFARYSLVGAIAAAVGSLAAALPASVAGITGISPRASLQVNFVLYAALGPRVPYDVLLLAYFRNVRPPEEQRGVGQET